MAFPEKKPSTQSRPATSGARPQGSQGARPASTGVRPSFGGTRPAVAGARPASTGARPVVAGARPASAGQRQAPGQRDQARMTYINEMIKAPKVMIVDEQGEKLGTFSRDEALRRASSEGMDLVQLAYNPVDMICTAKIVDYGKYMYVKSKDDREKKKNQKSKGGKDIKMSYTIAENDLALKIAKATEFLEDGYTVRFLVRLRGREKIFVANMVEKLKGVEQKLLDFGKSQGVKEEPNGISLFLLPKSK